MRTLGGADGGLSEPETLSNAHFWGHGHGIGHSDMVLSGCGTNGMVLLSEYGHGGESGLWDGEKSGRGRAGGRKTSPNEHFRGSGHEIGHSDEVLSRQGTSDALLMSKCGYWSKTGP